MKTKTQLIGDLMLRPDGCSEAEGLQLTGWKSINLPKIGEQNGLDVVVSDSRPRRYYGAVKQRPDIKIVQTPPPPPEKTKTLIIGEMLQRPEGCTVEQACEASGWKSLNLHKIGRDNGLFVTVREETPRRFFGRKKKAPLVNVQWKPVKPTEPAADNSGYNYTIEAAELLFVAELNKLPVIDRYLVVERLHKRALDELVKQRMSELRGPVPMKKGETK